jgi:hypothetical protein
MVGPPITKRQLRADFLTSNYHVIGLARVGSIGFIGLMNDETSSTVEIQTASLSRSHQTSKLVDTYELVRLVKNHVQIVCLKRFEDIGPHTMGQGGYGTVSKHEILVTTSIYEIQGTIEWAGHFDVAALMAEGRYSFFPLYDVKITHTLIPSTHLERPVALINRRYVEVLALLRQRQKWE